MLVSSKTSSEEIIDSVDKILSDLITNYQNTNEVQRVDFRSLCNGWDWAKRSDVYTHYFHKYPAKLLPYIPIFFLSSSLISKNDLLLDPFSGTGTVGLESLVHRILPRNCLLGEINPLARLISATKTTPINPDLIKQEFLVLSKLINEYRKSPEIPAFPAIDFWFRKEAQIGLARIRDCIDMLETSIDVKDYFWVCFSSIIRDMSIADPKVSPPVRLIAEKFPEAQRDVVASALEKKAKFDAIQLFNIAVTRNLVRMNQFWGVTNATDRPVTVRVINEDARILNEAHYIGKGNLDRNNQFALANDSIGMVITSPPYINAQKYTRTTKFELWWLELVESSNKSLIEYDRSLIGTESILLQDYYELDTTNNPRADALIDRVSSIDRKKAGIINKYFKDMRLALQEIFRVLRPGGYCILVVGNNIIYKQPAPNNQILAEIAHDIGFILKTMLVDKIRSRGLITKRHETAGMISDEWVIVLQKPEKNRYL